MVQQFYDEFNPKVAQREKLKAVVGFIGPSGSGKTTSALVVAYGMMKEAYPNLSEEDIWKKIGLVDTEHKRSLLQVGLQANDLKIGQFLHIDFKSPYTTERYIKALQSMKMAGVEVIIFDSLSHNWNGEGGIVDTHSSMSGNSFQNWGKLSKETNNLVKELTTNDIHILSTLRTKQEYALEQDANGKMRPIKLGTKPVQKDDMEYEFMLNLNISMEHLATASKDNTQLFSEGEFVITEEVGRKLYKWLELGINVKEEERKAKERAEQERLELVEQIKQLAATSEAHQTKLDELIFLAKTNLDNFSIKLSNRTIEVLSQITNEKVGK